MTYQELATKIEELTGYHFHDVQIAAIVQAMAKDRKVRHAIEDFVDTQYRDFSEDI